jgi:hypothetical protein
MTPAWLPTTAGLVGGASKFLRCENYRVWYISVEGVCTFVQNMRAPGEHPRSEAAASAEQIVAFALPVVASSRSKTGVFFIFCLFAPKVLR